MQNINTLLEWINQNITQLVTAVVIILVTVIVFQLIKFLVYSQLRKFANRSLVDALADRIESIGWVTAIATGIYIASEAVTPVNSQTVINSIVYIGFIFVWTWQGINLVARIVDYLFARSLAKAGDDANVTAYKFLASAVKASLWAIALLLVLSNLGYNVDSLIAGLGIGGVAIALAVQAVLGDFISSFSIIADKPFKVGDFIIVGELMGHVEKIGIRSTRVRSIDGEEIVMPNSELVSSNIRNYGRLQRRRALHTIGVTYNTDHKLLSDLTAWVKSILVGNNMVEDDSFRINLVGYGDFSINFELQFYVKTADYNEFLDIQEQVLLDIKQKFDEEGVEFAFPTQTVYMAK